MRYHKRGDNPRKRRNFIGYTITALMAVCLIFSDLDASGILNAHAMHIMEGYLPGGWCIAWGVLCIPFIILGMIKLKHLIDNNGKIKLLIALCAAFVFIVSSLKIPSLTGSCSHATGTGLGAILFGPSIMAVMSFIVLLFQALLLAHGGLTTLGANTFSMGVFGPIVSFVLFKTLKKTKLSSAVVVFISAMVGDMATYILTSVQLASAYPGSDFVISLGKFLTVFAPTQLPIAIAEGILTVIIYGIIEKNCIKELKQLSVIASSGTSSRKLWIRNACLVLGLVLLVSTPLMVLRNTEFGGTDDAGSDVIEEIAGEDSVWFSPVWEPPSGEVESLIFCVQSALGAGICGFVLGRIVQDTKAKREKSDSDE